MAVLPSCVGLVVGRELGEGWVVSTGVLRDRQSQSCDPGGVKARLCGGNWVRWSRVDGDSKTRHTLVGHTCGPESACVCLLFIAKFSASYEGSWCLVRPPHQPGPSMTLNILSRQTSDPSPKESPDINPSRSSSPALGPRLSPVEKPSHILLSPGLLRDYLCFPHPLANLSSMQQPKSY